MKKLKLFLMMLLMLVSASGCVSRQAPEEDGKTAGLVLYEDTDEESTGAGSGLKEISFEKGTIIERVKPKEFGRETLWEFFHRFEYFNEKGDAI